MSAGDIFVRDADTEIATLRARNEELEAKLAELREEYAAYVKDCKANHYVKRSVWK